jgi:hypothetical protein
MRIVVSQVGGGGVAASPLDRVVDFWKPRLDPACLGALSAYADPEVRVPETVCAWRTEGPPGPYRVVNGASGFSLFASVHPVSTVPPSAEVLAEIQTPSGAHHSYVLWYPDERCVTVPFDPNAAIDALLREEYVPPAKRTALPRPLLSLYYAVKPAVPVAVKGGLRKMMARRADSSKHFLDWPSDRSHDLLQRLMLRAVLFATNRGEAEFAWFWPDGRPWAVVLTHDVETAQGLEHVPHIAAIERERGLRSSFNLVPLDYEVPEPLLESLRADGFEIGVHGDTHDGMLFSKFSTFSERVETINSYARAWKAEGFRSPATYRNPDWMHLLGFEYDSSYTDTAPFEPQPGGCASWFPYPLGDLTELPMTLAQDHTLFGLLEQSSAHVWLDKLETIREANGMACVLTHPDPARGYIGLPENEAHYRRVLDLVAGSNAWTPLPRDLARWWRVRAESASDDADRTPGIAYATARLDPSGELEIVAPTG